FGETRYVRRYRPDRRPRRHNSLRANSEAAAEYSRPAYRQEDRLCRWHPRSGRTPTESRQRRDEGRVRAISRYHEATHGHRRQREYYAAKDNLVRTQAP